MLRHARRFYCTPRLDCLQHELVCSAAHPGEFPPSSLPQVLVCGRTNAGKSSMLNQLFRGRKLADVSSRPGVTEKLDFYNVDDKIMFVDSPGLGANLKKTRRRVWGKMLYDYVTSAQHLKLIMLLMDIRANPNPDDHHLLRILSTRRRTVPILLVLTKDDNVEHSQRVQRVKDLQRRLKWTGKWLHYSIKDRRARGKMLRHVMTTCYDPENSILLPPHSEIAVNKHDEWYTEQISMPFPKQHVADNTGKKGDAPSPYDPIKIPTKKSDDGD